jgi:hypothetical protein
MAVEIIMEGPVQGYRSQRRGLGYFDAAAFFAEDGGRDLQRQLARRAGEVGLRESRDGGEKATDRDQRAPHQLDGLRFNSGTGGHARTMRSMRRSFGAGPASHPFGVRSYTWCKLNGKVAKFDVD